MKNPQCSSISSRLAMFEKNIARNAEYAARNNSSRNVSRRRLKTWREHEERKCSDCDSVQTVRTCGTGSTYYQKPARQSWNTATVRATDHGDDTSHNSFTANCDVVSLFDSPPTSPKQGDDSFDSSLSTLDLMARDDEDEEALFTSILQSSASRLCLPRSISSRSVNTCVSLPCTSTYSGSRGENLHSLMSLLDKCDDKKKSTADRKPNGRRPKVSNPPFHC